MADEDCECDHLASVLHIDDWYTLGTNAILIDESLDFADSMTYTYGKSLVDELAIDDEIGYGFSDELDSTLHIDDSRVGFAAGRLVEVFQINDQIGGGYVEALLSTLEASDEMAGTPGAHLHSTLAIDDVPLGHGAYADSLATTLEADDTIEVFRVYEFSAELNIDDELRGFAGRRGALLSTLAIDDEHDYLRMADGLLASTLAIDDAMEYARHVVDALFEDLFIDDHIGELDQSVLWTAQTDTFAMSQLMTGGVTTIAGRGAELIGGGLNGVYGFSGTGSAPRIATGVIDLGSALGRITHAYVSHHGKPLKMGVTNTATGAPVRYEYDMNASDAVAPIPSKVKFGRGTRSRHWQFDVAGEQFGLHGITAETDQTSRRI